MAGDDGQSCADAQTWPDPVYLNFRIGDAFTPGDPLSEWVVVLGLAANDVSVLGGWLGRDDSDPGRYTYLVRLLVAHFFELGESLALHAKAQAVADFIAAMGDKAAGYRTVVETHERLRTRLREIRSLTAFHYPRSPDGGSPLTEALRASADSGAVVILSDQPGVFRLGFSDEIVAALFNLRAGGSSGMDDLVGEVMRAIPEFIEFVSFAAAEFVGQSGAEMTQVRPDDPGLGWLPVRPEHS